jgi:hypothetical protein
VSNDLAVLAGWPQNISPALKETISIRQLYGDGEICFSDDLNKGKTYIANTVIPVREFTDGEPNGTFEANMRYAPVAEGSNLGATCVDALYRRFLEHPDIELCVVCGRFDRVGLEQQFIDAYQILVYRHGRTYDARLLNYVISSVFPAVSRGCTEYKFKQQAGSRKLLKKLLVAKDVTKEDRYRRLM